jgi:hypothetical protein
MVGPSAFVAAHLLMAALVWAGWWRPALSGRWPAVARVTHG